MAFFSFLDLKGYGHLLFVGAGMTLAVGFCSMLVALCFGMAGALAKQSNSRLLRIIGGTYTTVVRGVPELVLLLIVYYGGTMLLQNLMSYWNPDARIDINAFLAGTIVLGFVYGAYATEIFRGAFQAVHHGQIEAAISYGMSGGQVFVRILLPQALRLAIPGLGNLWLTLLKATSVTSVIGLTELARQSDLIKSPTHLPFTTFFAASLLYLAMTAVSDLIRMKAEAWAGQGFKRVQ